MDRDILGTWAPSLAIVEAYTAPSAPLPRGGVDAQRWCLKHPGQRVYPVECPRYRYRWDAQRGGFFDDYMCVAVPCAESAFLPLRGYW